MIASLNQPLQLTVTEVVVHNGTRFQCLEIDLAVPKLDPAFLSELQLPADLDLSQGVMLWGAAPIWLYSHLVKRYMSLAAAWVGTFDIRTRSFVVVASRCSDMVPGQVFELINQSQSSAILIGGPPNSGKSVLCYALDYALKQKAPHKNIHLHRAQWDGEGTWFAEMENRSLAEELSKRCRVQGTDQFFLQHAKAVRQIRQSMELVIVDFGGMPKPADLVLLRRCTHYIIISRDQDAIAFWHDFCGRRGGLKPLAVLHSVNEQREQVLPNQHFLEMIAGPWVRGKRFDVPKVLLTEVLKLLIPH